MPIRTIATLGVALFLGLIAVVLVRTYLVSSRGPAPATAGAVTDVVVASAAVERGVAIQPNLVKVVQYPAGSVPEGAFRTVAEVTGTADQPRLALRTLAPNEPILPTKITAPGQRLNLSGVVTDGMRAVSLRSNDVAGVAGFVLPGDRVDILLTRDVGEGRNVTQVLADNVRVLGVDQIASEETDKPVVARAVTVEVTPEQAQKISLAQAVGSVSLALRHVADNGALGRQATTVADLGFGGARARPVAVLSRPAAPAIPSDQREVFVTRGVEKSGYRVSIF